MAFTTVRETAQEWYDTTQVPAQSTNIVLPEPDGDYAFASARLFSWFPVVNSKGATYFPEDFDNDLLQTLIGKQANLKHDKGFSVIGSIISFDIAGDGLDIGIRIDREQMAAQGVEMADMHEGNYFSHVSVELTRDLEHSWFYAVDDGYNVLKKIPVLTGLDQGIRRTTASDPYKLQGKRVVERIKPARFTGVGFVPNPADRTAKLFAVTASADSEDKPLPDNTGTHQAGSSAETAQEKSNVTEAELKARIEALEADVARLTTEKEQASAEAAKVANLQKELTDAKAALAAKETELASATTELETFKTEKAAREKQERLTTLVGELETILPCADEAERTSLREEAAHYLDDAGRIQVVKLERTVKAKDAQIATLSAPKPEAKPEAKPEDKPAAKPGEKASVEDEPFKADRPKIGIAPTFANIASKRSYSKEELNEVF